MDIGFYHSGLTTKDTNDLWIQADFDGNSLKQF